MRLWDLVTSNERVLTFQIPDVCAKFHKIG